MSGLAGIFKFDPRARVTLSGLMELASGMERIAPDGGAEYANGNLGMVYRAFHTTPESHQEIQPLVQNGCVLTWDGRLDNREEIRAKVVRKYEGAPTDIDLVFAAYERWGTSCFAELTGDWALALWDEGKHQLILARDYIGVRRLFYRLDDEGLAWCSILEPLVLTAPQKLHLDLDYLRGSLYPRPPVETSPYREIRSVPPSHLLTFRFGGERKIQRYWALNPHSRIRYTSDADYEHHFSDAFRKSIERRLRADHTVLAELSGGLDSSSIVCIADAVRRDLPSIPIETLSYYDSDEPSGDERPYISLIEQHRGHAGYRISKSEFNRQTSGESLQPLPIDHFAASPGYFGRSLRWASVLNEIRLKSDARVILSGLGGDEVLGGVQYEAPELAEFLLAGRLISLARSLFQWSLARKKTVFELLSGTFELLGAAHDPNALISPSHKPFAWARLKPLARHPNLAQFADWRNLWPSQLALEWIRYNLASQLTCTDPPLVGREEKRYPYLDRELFVFLASIPRSQIVQAGHRRHLMRRALRGLVPEGVLFRKTKWFGSRSALATISSQAKDVDGLFNDGWVSDGLVVDTALVRNELQAVQKGVSAEGIPLLSAIAIEQWLRALIARGCIEMPSDLDRNAARSAAPVSQALVTHRGN